MVFAQTIPISVPKNLVERYYEILQREGKRAEEFEHFNIKKVTKGFVSLVIIKQALTAGGLDVDFELIMAPNSSRGAMLVQSGVAVMSQQTMFKELFTDDLWMSSVILGSGEHIKGIYGLASNKALMQVSTLEGLQKLSAVINTAWKHDIRTLEDIMLDSLHITPNYDAQFKLIKYREIDFTLLDFSHDIEKPQIYGGVELYPVPNVAIEIIGDRHFMVSKKHPDGAKVYQALEKGLKTLRSKGLIRQYYGEAKVIRSDLSDWKILNKALRKQYIQH